HAAPSLPKADRRRSPTGRHGPPPRGMIGPGRAPLILTRLTKPVRTFGRQLRVRPRLLTATVLGVAAAVLLPRSLASTTRALLAWDTATALYLVLAWKLMLGTSVEVIRKKAKLQDDGAAAVLGLTLAAAGASLVAIVSELIGARNHPDEEAMRLGVVAVTLV